MRQEYNQILLSRSTDGGATFVTPDTRVDSDTVSEAYHPAIAAFDDDVVLVAWESWQANRPSRTDTRFARSTDGGVSFGIEQTLNDTAGNGDWQAQPSVDADNRGRVYVMWTNGPGWELGFTITDDTGRTFRHETGIPGSYGGQYPSLWAARDGRLYVGWMIWGDYDDVRFAYSPDGGGTFYRPVNPSDAPFGTWENSLTVTANENGAVFVAWRDYTHGTPGATNDVYFAAGAMTAISQQPTSPTAGTRLDVVGTVARGVVRFEYALPSNGAVRIEVLDLTGRRVALLHDGFRPAGTYRQSWDGHDEHGTVVRGGIYFLRLATRDDAVSRKIMLVRE